MRDLHEPGHVGLGSLIGWLKEGRFAIPDFQREFEWKPQDIRELTKSIFQDYYIGSLLLWRSTSNSVDTLSCESIYGFQGDGAQEYIVLDGQQRLTAIYYAFVAPAIRAPNRSNRYLFYVRVDDFMREDYDDAFDYDWTIGRINFLTSRDGKGRERQYDEHIFPLWLLGSDGWELPNWAQGYEAHWRRILEEAIRDGDQSMKEYAEQCVDNASGFGKLLVDIMQTYQVTYIMLERNIEIDKVCEIFTKINSRGLRLDAFDLINALVKPKGVQLKQLGRNAAQRLEAVDIDRMDIYVLQVMSILCQEYCSPKYLYNLIPGKQKKVREKDGSLRTEILISDAGAFEQHWHQAVEALEQAVGLLSHPKEFGVILPSYLPYASILPVFSAIQTRVNSLPANMKLSAQDKVRLWYWASVFTQRYSSAVESTSREDYVTLQRWFEDNGSEPSTVSEFRGLFKTTGLDDSDSPIDLEYEVRRGSAVYNGVFNLLVLKGARDWITGLPPQHNNLDDHHIIPQSWGNRNGLYERINTILNRTPLTPETNRHVIRDRLPKTYLKELIHENGEPKVREIMASHYISDTAFDVLLRDPFGPDDFEEFIADREESLLAGIRDLIV